MKKGLLLILVFALCIYLLPLAALLFPGAPNAARPATPPESAGVSPGNPVPSGASASSGTAAEPQPKAEEPLLILDERTGEVMTVPVRDFVRGAVAAEMPINWSDEALRAQAVAAHSYALAVKAQHDPNDPALKGAYFSANPAQRLGFVTESAMHAMWGDQFEENVRRLDSLVDSVLGEVLFYQGAPALACYHAVSAGKTEDAACVWGSAVPYLVSVDSMLDLTAPDYEQSFTITKQELEQDLCAEFPSLSLSGDAADWFGTPVMTQAGYVKSIPIGGLDCAGTAVRRALRLRSTAFRIRWTDEHLFEITTHGYGHGVGMSQYGAHALALTGKSHQEILAHYYPGTTLGVVPLA